MIVELFAVLSSSFTAFPARWTIRGTWSVPYTNLSNPILIVNEPTRQYTSKYNGLEQIWDSGDAERVHRMVVVAGNHSICYGTDPSGSWDVELTQFLPSPENFTLVGTRVRRGISCQLWEYSENTPKKQTWQIYIDSAGHPVSYIVHAISMYQSHYDVYILDVDEFIPDVLPGYWQFPDICENYIPEPSDISTALLPTPSNAGYQPRKPISKFMRRLGRRSVHSNEALCRPYTFKNDVTLPSNFSWRDVPNVVGPPRDQVACGSCWAFGTAESLESQVALKSGVFRELSVNEIMDCTWPAENNGCQGGESAPAFRYMINNKIPLAYEKEYPYIGVSGICEQTIEKPVAYVTDCISIERTNEALKEAVFKYGPATIGINVVESMYLYVSGVVDDDKCTGAEGDLVHEVLLTGWRNIDGKEAWEIKNSWSTNWGNDGYVYIEIDNQERNCGVTTDAKIPFVELAK